MSVCIKQLGNSSEFKFDAPLTEGIIKSRPNRFLMNVEIEGKLEKCHCPTTGKVGKIIFNDVPCLLSKSTNKHRKTIHTVEAFSLDTIDNPKKNWVGINQIAVNKYVEHFLKAGLLGNLAPVGEMVLREQTLGSSRLDFRVGNTYIEVKMPLIHLFINPDEALPNHGLMTLDRFIKHIHELGNSLDKNHRAILLTCFVFDAPKFIPPAPSKYNVEIFEAMNDSMKKGIEVWQLNLSIDKFGVEFLRYFEITSIIGRSLEQKTH
ncbi:MAG: DNA/RNA nuclease SfsA [Puniceicoccales bacterium]|jgi:sugar fermentation stimulation protein A|nr:DNA/RNA nuclease SfsA [Puniceicoccales bacterium]